MPLFNTQETPLFSMPHNPAATGIAYAMYGAGARIASLIFTQFAHGYTTNFGTREWMLHYAVLLVFTLSVVISFLVRFRGKGYEEILRDMGA